MTPAERAQGEKAWVLACAAWRWDDKTAFEFTIRARLAVIGAAELLNRDATELAEELTASRLAEFIRAGKEGVQVRSPEPLPQAAEVELALTTLAEWTQSERARIDRQMRKRLRALAELERSLRYSARQAANWRSEWPGQRDLLRRDLTGVHAEGPVAGVGDHSTGGEEESRSAEEGRGISRAP